MGDAVLGGLGLGDLLVELGGLAVGEAAPALDAWVRDASSALDSPSEHLASWSNKITPTSPTAAVG